MRHEPGAFETESCLSGTARAKRPMYTWLGSGVGCHSGSRQSSHDGERGERAEAHPREGEPEAELEREPEREPEREQQQQRGR